MRYCYAAAVLVVAVAFIQPARAQDPDIDRLLKKLPAPEKVVRSEVAPGMKLSDPVFQDPLARELSTPAMLKNPGRSLQLARKLTAKYPRSVIAHVVRGSLALQVHQVAESVTAYRTAVDLAPKLWVAHLGLGVAEGARSRFTAAWPHLRTATQLEPKAVPAWVYLSACAERLGRKEESVSAARRATQAAPRSLDAWAQLARAQHSAGRQKEALAALSKARALAPRPRR